MRLALPCIAALLLACATAGTAAAQESQSALTCPTPAPRAGDLICSSPYLRLLATTVESETQALLMASPMRATLRAEHQAFVRALATRPMMLDPRGALSTRLRTVRAAAAQTAAALTARPTRQELEERCQPAAPPFMETELMQCKAVSVLGAGPRMIAQLQRWNGPADSDPALGPLTAMLLFMQVEDGAEVSEKPIHYRLVGWAAADDADLGAPVMVEGEDRVFVTLPRTNRGSSASTTDMVLMGTQGSREWREVNVSDWFDELGRRLPRGLVPKSAYSLDLLGMRASAYLAREGDANCCPSGGTADVTFKLRDDALAIDSLLLRRPQPMPPQRPTSQPRRM